MRTRRRVGAVAVAMLAALSIGFTAGCGDDDDSADTTTAASPPASPPPATTPPPATSPPATTPPATTPPATTPPPSGMATTVEIPAADQGLAFAMTEATVGAGTVTVSMPNPSPIPHNIALEDPPAEGEVVGMGETSMFTVELVAGDYTYFCTVAGHREAGMEGTLTVE